MLDILRNLDLNVIIVAGIGLLGTIFSPIISNWINSKKQIEINKLEIDKLRLQSHLEIKKELYNNDIKDKSEAFSNFIYCACKWRYSSTANVEDYNEYLKSYGKICSFDISENCVTLIDDINMYLIKSEYIEDVYDQVFENYISVAKTAFIDEIRLLKSQIKNNNIQE